MSEMRNVVPFRPCPTRTHGADVPDCVCADAPLLDEVRTDDESMSFDAPTPDNVVLRVSLFNSQLDNSPKAKQATWARIVEILTPERPPVVSSAKARPAWSPAVYAPGATRSNAAVLSVSMLALDVDDGTEPEKGIALFGDNARLLHSSWSHQREKKGTTCARWRLVVPFTDPCPPARWDRVWRGAQLVAKQAGVTVDSAVDSTSELYFLPALRDEEQPWVALVGEGGLLDWRDLEKLVPPTVAKPRLATSDPLPFVPSRSAVESRIAGMVRVKCAEIEKAESRHEVLLSAGRYIGGLCARYQIDPSPFVPSILAAAGDSNDAPRTLQDALEYGQSEPCDLPPDRPSTPRKDTSGRWVNPTDGANDDVQIENLARLAHTDLGNAKRLDARYGLNLRWSEGKESWLVWLGTHWEWDERRQAHRWSQDTVERLADEVAHFQSRLNLIGEIAKEGEPEDVTKKRSDLKGWRDAAKKHAFASQSTSRIAAAPAEARALAGKAVALEDLDTEPWLLNLLNGTLDLQTGELHPHNRDNLITRLAPVEYDPSAGCPYWTAFMAEVFPVDSVRRFVQRALGYSLTGIVREQVWFVLKGEGSNGKSTVLEIVRTVLGKYAIAVPASVLEQQLHEKHETELVDFKGARFSSGTEPRKGRKWDAEKVKRLTGEDRIKARGMRENFSEFNPTHKLWVACNGMPSTDDDSHGFWRRILMIPFTVQFRRPEDVADDRKLADPTLGAKLRSELPGILNWMLEGLREWQAGGLQVPKECVAAAQEYRAEQDEVAQFVADQCEVVHGFSTSSAELFRGYRRWREDQGMPGHGVSQVMFGRKLPKSVTSSTSGGRAIRHGIRFKEPTPEEALGPDPPDGW